LQTPIQLTPRYKQGAGGTKGRWKIVLQHLLLTFK